MIEIIETRYKSIIVSISGVVKIKVSNTRFNLTFVLARKLPGRSLLMQLPFYATFVPTLPRYVRRQSRKCRLSGSYVDLVSIVFL